jgi:hypothetical protein
MSFLHSILLIPSPLIAFHLLLTTFPYSTVYAYGKKTQETQKNKYYIVESLQSHMILTMSHWSSGLTCLLPATRVTGSNPQGGTYVEPGFSC